MKKTKNTNQPLSAHDLGKYIKNTRTIPVPDYSKETPRELIVQPRTIWGMKRTKCRRRTKKPIEF